MIGKTPQSKVSQAPKKNATTTTIKEIKKDIIDRGKVEACASFLKGGGLFIGNNVLEASPMINLNNRSVYETFTKANSFISLKKGSSVIELPNQTKTFSSEVAFTAFPAKSDIYK